MVFDAGTRNFAFSFKVYWSYIFAYWFRRINDK